MALAKINEVLFDNNDKIPEGLYLELMNLTRDLFNEKPEPVIKWRNVFKEPIKHRLRGIRHATESYTLRKVDIIDENLNRALRYRGIGDFIECVAFGNKKKILRIDKINCCSIQFMEYTFWKGQIAHRRDEIIWKLKFGEKHPMGADCLYGNLLHKEIMFYDMTASESRQSWDACNIEWCQALEAFNNQSPPHNPNELQSPEWSPPHPDISDDIINLPVDF